MHLHHGQSWEIEDTVSWCMLFDEIDLVGETKSQYVLKVRALEGYFVTIKD